MHTPNADVHSLGACSADDAEANGEQCSCCLNADAACMQEIELPDHPEIAGKDKMLLVRMINTHTVFRARTC